MGDRDPAPRTPGLAERLLWLACRAYPRGRARALAHDMARVATNETRRRRADRGPLAACAFLGSTVAGALLEGFRQRLEPRWLTRLGEDASSAARTLVRSPAMSLFVVASLALGIGADTAVFSVMHTMLYQLPSYRDADRVVYVEVFDRHNEMFMSPLRRHLQVLREDSRAFERVEARDFRRLSWRRADTTLEVRAEAVTPALPELLGLTPVLGRGLAVADGAGDAEPVALISEGLWQRELGANAAVLGTTMLLDDVTYTVVGVLPSLPGQRAAEVWIPLRIDPADNDTVSTIGWLREGVDVKRAEADLARLTPRLAARAGPLVPRLWLPGQRMRESTRGTMLRLLVGAVSFVLLILCANIASLLMSRNLARRREIAVRSALGAGRARIVRQLVLESLLLALAGGAFGLLIATWGSAALLRLRPASLALLYPEHVPLNATIVAFALGVSLLTGLAVSCWPALRAARTDLAAGLIGSGRRGAAAERRFFAGVVALEAALSAVLLVGAGVLTHSFVRLQQIDPGLEAERIVEVSLKLDVHAAPEHLYARASMYEQIAERVARLPGVEAATVASAGPPFDYVAAGRLEIEGRPIDEPPRIVLSMTHVGDDYFRIVGTPLVQGRPLTTADERPFGESPQPAVVSEPFARRVWPDESAVGKRFRLRQDRPWWEIVGVARDVEGRGLGEDSDGEIYVRFPPRGAYFGSVLARVERPTRELVEAMRDVVVAHDARWVLYDDVRPLRDKFARTIDVPRFNATLLAIFASLAVLLAMLGVFGVTTYATRRRNHEIGIRIALGADGRGVVRLVVRQGLLPAIGGLAIGLVAARALGGVLDSLVHEVSPADPLTHAVTALVLLAGCLLATWIPARHAAGVDPLVALRED